MIWRIEILFLNLQTEMQKRYEYGYNNKQR